MMASVMIKEMPFSKNVHTFVFMNCIISYIVKMLFDCNEGGGRTTL